MSSKPLSYSFIPESKSIPSKLFKILLVDDDFDILKILSYNLHKNGYQVRTASNGFEAIEKAKYLLPDLIILDMMMPEKNGLQTCIELRANSKLSKTVIIILTALFEENNQILAFQLGADDYITKPIQINVFLSRIQAHLRRSFSQDRLFNIAKSELVLNNDKYSLLLNGREIFLSIKEFKLLQLLISIPGKVFSKDEIITKVWGTEMIAGDRSLDVLIRKLREKIGQNFFKTIKGVGYKIDA